MTVTDLEIRKASEEILGSISDGSSLSQIEKELRDLSVKHLIKIDKAKTTLIYEHSLSNGHLKHNTNSIYQAKYVKKRTFKNLVTVDSVSVGMKGFQMHGVVDCVDSRFSNGKSFVKAVFSDDTGDINITFWWDFTTISDGDEITITYASCTEFRDELNINVNYENNVIFESFDEDDPEVDDL